MLFHRGVSRALAGAILATSFASPALAQAATPITLAEALARAEAQAPALAQAKAGVDAARGRTRQAGLGPNPEIRLEVENFSGSGLYSGLDLAETTLGIGQTIELGGKRRTRVAAGRAEIVAAETQQAIARAELTAVLKQSFSNALAARAQMMLATAALERARDLSRVAQTLVDAGREPPLRALRARSAAAEAEAELQRLVAEDAAARGQLGAILGDATAPSEVAGSFEQLTRTNALISPSETLDVRLAEAEADLARAIVSRERAAASTDVTVELGVRQFRDGDESAVVFGASAPIPILNRNQGAISAAAADVNAANARRLQTLADAARNIRDAEGALAAAESRVRTLEAIAGPAADEGLTLARTGFEAGRFSLLDVLDAEDAYASAQSSLIDARRDRANAAAALDRALAR